MATTSFGCALRLSFLAAEKQQQALLKTTSFPASSWQPSSLSSSSSSSSNRGIKRAVCAVAYKPTGKPRGIMRPRRVSPAMQELVGVPEISRTEALKLIWAYIKQNNLQDPDDKRIIVCDEKLKKIFAEKDRVKFLEVAGLITPHFL